MVVFPGGAPNSRIWCENRPVLSRISTPIGGLEAVLGILPPKEANFGGEKTCGSLTVEPEPAPVSQRQTAPSPRHHGHGGGEDVGGSPSIPPKRRCGERV